MLKQITLLVGLLLPALALAQNCQRSMAEKGFDRLPTELQLSDEQQAEIEKIRTETQTAYEQLRMAETINFDQIRQLQREGRERAKAVLSEEQRNYLANRRESHRQERQVQREEMRAARRDMLDAMRAYKEEYIEPVRQAARTALDQQISAADRATLAQLREVLTTRPRPERAEQPSSREERRDRRSALREARENWRTNHQADIDLADQLTEKYREQIDAALASFATQRDQWREELEKIRSDFQPDAAPRRHRGRRHHHGQHGHHPPPPPEGEEEHPPRPPAGEEPKHDRGHHKARAFLLLAPGQPGESLDSAPDNYLNDFILSPNPASELTQLTYQLPTAGTVQVSVVDENGRLVQQLPQLSQEAGFQQINLDLTQLPAGSYRVLIEANGLRSSKALIIGQ